MPYVITITAYYDDPADQVFDSALDFAEMQTAMSDIARYDGLPSGRVAQGMTFTCDVTFWGLIRNKGHVMHVETLDRDARILQSREHGPSVARWDHLLSVQPDGDGAVWTDQITLDAGWRSWGMARFCRFMYRHRHIRRQAQRITTDIQPLRIT